MRKFTKKSRKKTEKDYAVAAFNLYIRWRDADEWGRAVCCSCGKLIPIGHMDAGHFVSCDWEATRFDEQNCHAQCRNDNRFRSGRQADHGIYIDKLYGAGTAEEIRRRSKLPADTSEEFYKRIKVEYRVKLKALLKERGLE